jgi:hypothetical protein
MLAEEVAEGCMRTSSILKICSTCSLVEVDGEVNLEAVNSEMPMVSHGH